MALIVSPPNNQYSLRVPSHRFRQGGRDVYYFALDLETLDGLLPQRVEDSVVRDANRRLTPSHAKNIQRYLAEEGNWLLGALMLGIARNAVEFDPYKDVQGEPGDTNFGELRIRTNRLNTMRIFDGQHRRRAIQDVLAELSNASDDSSADKLDALRTASMTIVLYAEDDLKTLRQMFVDASKTKRIEGNTVTRFDQRDAFNLAAVRLANNSRLFKGRVEMERSSVGRSSQHLLAINQLASTLKSLEVGYGRRVSRNLNDNYMQDLDGLYHRCLRWADEFMPATREEYSGLLSGEIENSEIPQFRATTFAHNTTFIRVLAECYRRWVREHDSWKPLAKFIREALIDHGIGHGLPVDAGKAVAEDAKSPVYATPEDALAVAADIPGVRVHDGQHVQLNGEGQIKTHVTGRHRGPWLVVRETPYLSTESDEVRHYHDYCLEGDATDGWQKCEYDTGDPRDQKFRLWCRAKKWAMARRHKKMPASQTRQTQGRPSLLVDAGLATPDGKTLFFRRQDVARAIDYIVGAAEAAVQDQDDR